MEYSATKNGEQLELNISGKFTFSDNRAFNTIFEDIEKKAYNAVVIDLKGVDFIDSAALGILLLTRDKCEKSSTQLLIKNPRGQVQQMFDISRFSDLFKVVND